MSSAECEPADVEPLSDVELLSLHLQQAFSEKMLELLQGTTVISQDILDACWLRVAERAKELRT